MRHSLDVLNGIFQDKLSKPTKLRPRYRARAHLIMVIDYWRYSAPLTCALFVKLVGKRPVLD
jgi:hypothetical protein